MDTTPASFRINLQSREIEIRGSEEFVEQHLEGLEDLLELLGSSSPVASTPNATSGELSNGEAKGDPTVGNVPDTYGEWENGFPKDINGTDRALVAGLFVQKRSSENDFKTSEINKLLQEHGHKLSNPSQAMKNLEERKHIFRTRKKGTISYFRVAKTGETHIESLKKTS